MKTSATGAEASSNRLSPSAIAGVVLGAVIFVAILLALLAMYRIRTRRLREGSSGGSGPHEQTGNIKAKVPSRSEKDTVMTGSPPGEGSSSSPVLG
jgi:hypothetical protein